METVLTYLLKMLICSALLYGYYRVALYNERFHQWNRFYLLAAMALSVLVPFIHIPVVRAPEEGNFVTLIASLRWNAGESIPKQSIALQEVILTIVAFGSLIFLIRFLISIAKIVIAYYANPVSPLQSNVQLILTKLSQAPFSFFNWLFWRSDIDPASANGQRILNHELTHIYEHHTIDKLFTSLLLCLFWMNPFFWLMRNELVMIHEFLADRKAVNPQDRMALAEMILQGIPFKTHVTNGLVNPFFSSQIKRRLFMISTSKDPKYSYLRRISSLVLMAGSAITLALSIQEAEAQKTEGSTVIREKAEKRKAATSGNKISITADTIFYQDKKNGGVMITSPGQKVKAGANDTHPNPIIADNEDRTGSGATTVAKSEKVSINDSKNLPLYILDGKEITGAEMNNLDAKLIKEINVLKGESAINKYGEKARNGAIEIKTKTKEDQNDSKETIVIKANNKTKPLYYLDGKAITNEELNKIAPEKIESITVLKGESAIKKYGEKGKDGVVEILLKKPLT
jgi:hypothetical protein